MKTTPKSVSSVIMLALITGSGSVTAQEVNPNGFPSGPHYNLNIHGKKEGYFCTTPAPYLDTGTGEMVYPNNIFVPEDGVGIQILVQSGSARKGGKASTEYPVFQVTDACAFGAGDPAVVQLPPNENGHRVYARALAKPVSSWTLHDSTLYTAQDEYGNELIDLGLIKNGTAKPGETLLRVKGKSTAVDITRLFEFTGTICSIDFTKPLIPYVAEGSDGYAPVCWSDVAGIGEGSPTIHDTYSLPSVDLLGGLSCAAGRLLWVPAGFTGYNYTLLCWNDKNNDGFSNDDTFEAPIPDGIEGFSCTAGQLVWVPIACTTYTAEDHQWMFNLAELVEASWLLDNSGGKLLQVRFYPQ